MGNRSFADAEAFRSAAVSGQIGVDPDAAQTVLRKIRGGKDAVESLLRGAGALAEAPKLGANPVGQAISAKMAKRAAGGDDDSYAQALRNLYIQYDQAEQAIVTAMSRYQEIDDANAQPFRRHV
ncbi:hypothetical protein SAMN05421810_102904 [Amycolatopsis arida]|uniref:Uncharacterized protein n=1 Tax=Amycolatopsis arida TaxID=587909 RepID=A0A1I5R7I6_9PSEU|nr:hypothetical protein [Amycolatopsis arida]TDX99103.1 hypothetical protein CLV69_101905 [Amycolatopsis arida]SFP54261.1 hypothetical protein SAMN05421810_102904 [Amycolatopsis arida]